MKDNKMKKYKAPKIEHWQVINLGLFVYDIFVVNAAFFIALMLRFDFRYSEIPTYYLEPYMKFAPIYTVLCIGVFWVIKLYKSIWRFASYSELIRVVMATMITGVLQCVGITVLFERMPLSYYIFGIVLQFCAVIGIRFSYRLILILRNIREKRSSENDVTRIMIIGAGEAGRMLIREMNRRPEMNVTVCCIIDDNPNKWNRYIEGVPVVGNRDDIMTYAKKHHIDRILFAIPSASAESKRDI